MDDLERRLRQLESRVKLLEVDQIERNARAAERRRILAEQRRRVSKRDAAILSAVVALASIAASFVEHVLFH